MRGLFKRFFRDRAPVAPARIHSSPFIDRKTILGDPLPPLKPREVSHIYEDTSEIDDDLTTTVAAISVMESNLINTDPDPFNGNGGTFDGGGASGSWE